MVPRLEVSISHDAIFHSKSKKMADWLKRHRDNFCSSGFNDADLIFGFPHYLKMAKVTDPHHALFLDPIDKKYAILFVTRKDYPDQNQKLATFVQAFQNSKHVQEILDRDFGQGLWFEGWK